MLAMRVYIMLFFYIKTLSMYLWYLQHVSYQEQQDANLCMYD